MTDLFVRPSSDEDTPILEAIRAAAREESSAHRGEPYRREEAPDRLVLVAGAGESVFGALFSSRTGPTEWTIHAVHVLAAARGVGIGNRLMGAFIEEVRRRGAHRIVSGAQPGDRSLKNLFESHGIVASTIIVGRDL